MSKRWQVLIVDDSPEDAAAWERVLLRDDEQRFEVIRCLSADSALEILERHQPDCMLLDYGLPGTSGLELLQRLKLGGRLNCPVVMLTGSGDEALAVAAIKMGASDYLVKDGLEGLALRRAVERTIRDFASEQEKIFIQQALHERDEQLKFALHAGGLGDWRVTLPDFEMRCSDLCRANFGVGPEDEFTYPIIVAMMHPQDRRRQQAAVDHALKTGEPYRIEYRITTPAGQERWIEAQGRVAFDQSGKPLFISGTTQNISERKQWEEQLRLYERVVLNSHDAVLITEAEPFDLPGPRILYVNPAFTHMTGYTPEEVIGQTPRILHGPKTDRGHLDKIRTALKAWQPVRIELTNYRKDGSEFEVELEIAPVADETGWFTHWVSVQREVSERKQAEQQRHQKAALEERQKLARDLHDSVSQALYGVVLGIESAAKLLDTPEKARPNLQYAQRMAATAMADMKNLIFELRPESLETEGLVAALERKLEAVRLRGGYEVKTNLSHEPPLDLPAKEALYRIAQESLHNIVKHAQSTSIEVVLEKNEGFVTLAIGDNGKGFDAAASYPGHLGLVSMKERSRLLGGELSVYSEPGKGTRVLAVVPLGVEPE